jgi:hypothetical protein
MSNSNFVVTQATTTPGGIVSLGSIISPAPFFDPVGNLNMNGLDIIGTATTATNVTITEETTSSVPFYPVFVSDNTGNLDLKVDKTTPPLSYTPSTGEFRSQSFNATITNGTQFSRLSSTQLQVADVPSNIVTITSNQITVGPSTSLNPTTISPTTVTATTFVTNTAPAAGNQLGNKTYIDNFGGSGGWYFTSTVSVTAGTVFAFTNCLSNAHNAYEIYFVPSISSPVSGYPEITMTFLGAGPPIYQSYITDQSQGVSSVTPGYNTNPPKLIRSLDYSVILNRAATMKVDLWGTMNVGSGTSPFRLTYVNEGFNSDNPGIKAWSRNTGTISFGNGTGLTGIQLTYNLTVTGSITIVVKSKY